METPIGLEALPIEPSCIIYILKEGTPPKQSKKQIAYENARDELFDPYVKFSQQLVDKVLRTREEELTEAIATSPLKRATDRGGFTLGSLLELNSMAIQELNGELRAKNVLNKTLEMVANEQESKVRDNVRYHITEGAEINRKTGSIVFKKFPSSDARDIAKSEAKEMQTSFDRAKVRLLQFTSDLK